MPVLPIRNPADGISPCSPAAESLSGTAQVDRQPYTRTSTPKVRTGCLTCKKRHIKCDEAKPFCMNCLKTRGHCEGYVMKPRKRRTKPQGQGTVSLAVGAQSPTRLLEPNLNTLDFSDDLSSMYFGEFIQLMRLSFSRSAALGKLWKVTMPQLARSNSILRDAAIAIGALSKAHGDGPLQSMQTIQGIKPAAVYKLKEQSPHYHNAVVHYCRALRLQGQALDNFETAQTTIFLCLLFVSFEVIRGDSQSALHHINYGASVMYTLLAGSDAERHIYNLGPNPQSIVIDVVQTFLNLVAQSRTVLVGRIGAAFPLPTLTEDLSQKGQTIESFFAAMIRFVERDTSTAFETIPDEFRYFDEAEQYWILLQYQFTQQAPMFTELLISNLFELEDDDEINSAFVELLQSPVIQDFQAKLQKGLEKWDHAFQPLFKKCAMESEMDRETFFQILDLRVHYLLLFLFSTVTKFTDYKIMESLTAQCREVVSLVELKLRKSQEDFTSPAQAVSLEGQSVWQLSIVAIQCRDPIVREDAIRVLSEYPRRDGLWNSRAFRALAIRNRMVERVNMSVGTPDEQWRRLWRRDYIFEDAGNRILFRFMDLDPATGQWGLVEEVGDLREDADEVTWTRQALTGTSKLMIANIFPVQIKSKNKGAQ